MERLDTIEGLLKSQKQTLSVDDLANLTGLSKSTIYKLTSSRRIPHYKQVKHLYFDRREIEAWIRSERIKTISEVDQEASNYVTIKSRES